MFRLFYGDQLNKFSLIVSKYHIISSNTEPSKQYHLNNETYF